MDDEYYPEGWCDSGITLETEEQRTHTRLLGPDGQPIGYPRVRFGFWPAQMQDPDDPLP